MSPVHPRIYAHDVLVQGHENYSQIFQKWWQIRWWVNRSRIGNHPWAIDWHHDLWPWMILNRLRSRSQNIRIKYTWQTFVWIMGVETACIGQINVPYNVFLVSVCTCIQYKLTDSQDVTSWKNVSVTSRICLVRWLAMQIASKTSIHRHQTQPRYRHVIVPVATRVSRHLSASRPLRPNVTSSIKPEVHNVAQRRQMRTEPRPQEIRTKISCRSVQRFQFQRYARGQTDAQTDRQTDGLITILRTPTRAE